jgi:hypothetical protein
VTAADVEALIHEQLAQMPAQFRERFEAGLRETPHREVKPPYDRVVISASGEIWVRHFLTSTATEPRSTWSVFAPSGEWLCEVTMAAGFVPFSITATHLAGTFTDENGEIFVRVHPLTIRPSSPGPAR